MNYVDTLLAHLARHKVEELGVLEHGSWSRTRRPYPHILPKTALELNLCCGLRAPMWELIRKRPNWRRHSDFAHLNSSQAMCWNVLMPALVLPEGLQQLTAAMALPAPAEDIDFEVVLNQAEFTNFDAVLPLARDGRALVEAKLTERKFGTASLSYDRESKRRGIYTETLKGRVPADLLNEGPFYANYQLLRNLSYLTRPEDRLVLLMPKANTQLVAMARSFVDRVLPPWQEQVSVLFVEDLIDRLLALQTTSLGKAHFEECRRKYVVPSEAR